MTAVVIADAATRALTVVAMGGALSDVCFRAGVDVGTVPPAVLQSPRGLAWSDVYGLVVSDDISARITSVDSSRLFPPPTLGMPNSQPTFNAPAGVAVTPADTVYVADAGNARIVQIDDLDGDTWSEYGSAVPITPGDQVARGAFRNPTGIAVDDLGRIYVTDTKLGSLVRFDDMSG
ncbi:hypothetical protein G3I15_44240, partial [Streptomyces sp. SID10244]|nr:hypothetical protein [Streptomyces sp. SID10244]